MVKGDNANETLAKELESDLLSLYGSPLLTGEPLSKALGFKSVQAMRQAILRGTQPVPVFEVKHKRGKHALVKDIARWLASQARQEEACL